MNSISGILRAADAREASYTYINHPRFKGARYRGMWMRGLPHGRCLPYCICYPFAILLHLLSNVYLILLNLFDPSQFVLFLEGKWTGWMATRTRENSWMEIFMGEVFLCFFDCISLSKSHSWIYLTSNQHIGTHGERKRFTEKRKAHSFDKGF